MNNTRFELRENEDCEKHPKATNLREFKDVIEGHTTLYLQSEITF